VRLHKPLKRTPLKKQGWSGRAARTPIKKRRTKPRRGPLRDKNYLAFIRQQECVIGYSAALLRTDCRGRIEAAHVGLRGLSQKSSDHQTIPLCAGHHRIHTDSQHNLGKNFWEVHGLNRDRLMRIFRERYLDAIGFGNG
jgi:hypothetical protein